MGNKIEGPLSYWKAEGYLGTKQFRNVMNNTTLVRIEDGVTGLRLHNTFVIKYLENGSIILNTGGWNTVTTRARINSYQNLVTVYVQDFEMIVSNSTNGIDYEFEDGMLIGSEGEISTRPIYLNYVQKILDKNFESHDTFCSFVQEAEIPVLTKLFKKRHNPLRSILAQNAPINFIPLMVAKAKPDEQWGEYARYRLSSGQ